MLDGIYYQRQAIKIEELGHTPFGRNDASIGESWIIFQLTLDSYEEPVINPEVFAVQVLGLLDANLNYILPFLGFDIIEIDPGHAKSIILHPKNGESGTYVGDYKFGRYVLVRRRNNQDENRKQSILTANN